MCSTHQILRFWKCKIKELIQSNWLLEYCQGLDFLVKIPTLKELCLGSIKFSDVSALIKWKGQGVSVWHRVIVGGIEDYSDLSVFSIYPSANWTNFDTIPVRNLDDES